MLAISLFAIRSDQHGGCRNECIETSPQIPGEDPPQRGAGPKAPLRPPRPSSNPPSRRAAPPRTAGTPPLPPFQAEQARIAAAVHEAVCEFTQGVFTIGR